jgi:hypothetical protein
MKKTFFILLAAAFVSCGHSSKPVSVEAYIESYEGAVAVNGKPVVSTGEKIHFGDIISSGEKSFCEIIFEGKNILRINPQSSLTFEVSTAENILKLNSGWLSATIKKITAKNGKFLIQTPTVTAAIRGTSFCTKVQNPESTYFCVCNGKIELKDAAGKNTDLVVAPHHAGRIYTKEKNGSISIDAHPGMLYHTDEGLETMSKKIGVPINWTKAE